MDDDSKDSDFENLSDEASYTNKDNGVEVVGDDSKQSFVEDETTPGDKPLGGGNVVYDDATTEDVNKPMSFLIAQGMSTIQKHLINRLSHVDQFNSLLNECESEMCAGLPPLIYKRLYNADKTPKTLQSMSIRSLFLLITYPKAFRDLFKDSETYAIKTLNDSLFKIFCIREEVLKREEITSVKKEIFASFCNLGLNAAEVEANYKSHKTTTQVEGLMDDLKNDAAFQTVFLKRAKSILEDQEVTPSNLKEINKRIERIEELDATNCLDNMVNLSSSIQCQLTESLTCTYCTKPFTEPRTLPCLHSACCGCLKSNVNQGDKTVTCPVCHTRVSVTDEKAVIDLPVSFVLSNLRNLLKRLDENPSNFQCEMCVHLALYYNLHEGLMYCEQHSYPLYQKEGHVVIKCTELLKPDKLMLHMHSYCPQHQKSLNQFCVSCKVPLCSSSACISWHSQHGELKSIKEETGSIVRDLQRLSSLLRKKKQVFLGKCKAAEENQVTVADLQENIKSSVEKYFEDIQMIIKDKKLQFLSDLNKAVDACWNQDEASRHALNEWNQKMQAFAVNIPDFDEKTEGETEQEQNCCKHSITSLITTKQKMFDLLADTASGCSLAELKSLSYPEGELRNLLQHVSNISSNITALPSSRGWEVAARLSGLRYFLVSKNVLYIYKRTILTGCSILTYDLKELGSQCNNYYTQGGMHDFQALALDEKGQLLIPGEVDHPHCTIFLSFA